jgi:hypothetical protein
MFTRSSEAESPERIATLEAKVQQMDEKLDKLTDICDHIKKNMIGF